MIAYFANDGSYGDADQLVIIDTSHWSDDRWDAVRNATDNQRISLAKQLDPLVVWKSVITEDMIQGLGNKELGMLIDALDDAVMDICNDWGMKI